MFLLIVIYIYVKSDWIDESWIDRRQTQTDTQVDREEDRQMIDLLSLSHGADSGSETKH